MTKNNAAINIVINLLSAPRTGVLLVLLFFLTLFISVMLVYENSTSEKLTVFIIAFVIPFLVIEVLFRLGYRLFIGNEYKYFDRVPFEDIYMKPHPYIPFVCKKKFITERSSVAEYPLHKEKYYFGQYVTNNYGYANGVRGDRDISVPKPNDLFRINCIGASTTGNYIMFEGKSYSYPMELEGLLKTKTSINLEVNNCGQGGYNSADLFVRTALQLIDTQPDVIILYHGYNDISAYLTRDFENDYNHVRKNLGETYWKFYIISKIPFVPSKFIDFLLKNWLAGDIRNSLLKQVSKGRIDLKQDPSQGLNIYRRNIQYIIDLCLTNNINVILSTYCHYIYDEIKYEHIHQLYSDIVEKENVIIRELASKNNLVLVDNAKLVPQDERYFVDSIHFTPEGMHSIASNISDAIQDNFLP